MTGAESFRAHTQRAGHVKDRRSSRAIDDEYTQAACAKPSRDRLIDLERLAKTGSKDIFGA